METRPTHCGKPMMINNRRPRKEWVAVQYICGTCGHTETVKEAKKQ